MNWKVILLFLMLLVYWLMCKEVKLAKDHLEELNKKVEQYEKN